MLIDIRAPYWKKSAPWSNHVLKLITQTKWWDRGSQSIYMMHKSAFNWRSVLLVVHSSIMQVYLAFLFLIHFLRPRFVGVCVLIHPAVPRAVHPGQTRGRGCPKRREIGRALQFKAGICSLVRGEHVGAIDFDLSLIAHVCIFLVDRSSLSLCVYRISTQTY
jgi:hypothetical protein